MPYKKGPNNTYRYYDKATGKYCTDPAFLALVSKKRKKNTQRKRG